jgi:hypothetical protein
MQRLGQPGSPRDDHFGNQTANLSSDFSQDARFTFLSPQVANSTLTITGTRSAGANAVLSGIFLNRRVPTGFLVFGM